MKVDVTTKAASIFLIILFLSHDMAASAFAIRDFSRHLKYSSTVQLSRKYSAGKDLAGTDLTEEESLPNNMISNNDDDSKVERQEYLSLNQEIHLGKHPENAEAKPSGHFLTIDVKKSPEEYRYAYLKYSVVDVKGNVILAHSINGHEAYLEEVDDSKVGGENIICEIDPADLKQGLAQIRFGLGKDQSFNSVTVSDVSLIFTNKKISAPPANKVERIIPDVEDFAVLATAVTGKYALKDVDMPSVPNNIVNVNRHYWGYLTKSATSEIIHVTITVNQESIPPGKNLSDVKIFYFDKEALSWKMAVSDSINMSESKVGASVPGNTNYFAGLIKTPEMPEAGANLPTMITDIKAANPSAGMNLISPPTVSPTGEAKIQYPIDIPAGRQGMTPGVNLSYSSDGGTGWLGLGWSIPVQEITLDTRWGVPSFPPNNQEEVYMMNGSALVQEGGHKGNRATISGGTVAFAPRISKAGGVRFFEPTMQSYKEIKRFGTGPTAYFWTETTAGQATHYYGTTNGTTLDTNYVLKDSNGNIIKWYLAKTKDKWGNTIKYTYAKHYETGNSNQILNGGFSMVLSEIRYTGFGSDPGKYSVHFHSRKGRADATVSLKTGMKILDDHILDSIAVAYNDTTVKSYKFRYSNSSDTSLFKTLLKSVSEYRSGKFFYKHDFDYYEKTISYSTPQVIDVSTLHGDKLNNIPEPVANVVSSAVNVFLQSPIKTTITSGWGAGGSIGLGIGPGPTSAPNKPFTFSGRLGYSQNNSWDKVNLEDFNGDGIPDIMYNNSSGAQYYPLTLDNESGQLALENYRKIHYAGKIMKSSSSSINYGLDFVLPANIFYYGMNWNKTKSSTSSYLTDYNADGVQDIVRPNGGNSIVLFGRVKDNGDVDFNASSENTLNPVFKGQQLTNTVTEDPPMDFEIVRTWEAPFDGVIDISGVASISTGLTGEASAAVQLNSSFLEPFQQITPGSGLSLEFSDISVSKGDKLLFRTRSGTNGQQDLVQWNPLVSYQSDDGEQLFDANGINYSRSTYEDGFLLSSFEGVNFSGSEEIKVDWPTFSINNLTDDVVLKIRLIVTDTTNGNVAYDYSYENPVLAGNSQTFGTGSFSEVSSSAAPTFLTGYNKVVSGLDDTYECQLTFEVWSTSNVSWKQIKWRPVVHLGDAPCNQQPKNAYPAVFYNTYNRVQQLDGPYTVSTSIGSGTAMRVWPDLNFAPSDLAEIFTTEELNYGDPIGYTAYLVTKSGGNLLSKMAITVYNDGTVDYNTVSANGTIGSGLTYNQSSSVYSFTRGSVVSNTLYIGFFTHKKKLGSFLANHLGATKIYTLSGGGASLIATTNNYNIFNQDLNELQDYYLHWGQFCWSESEELPIDTAEMHMAARAVAEDPNNDYSNGESQPGNEDVESMSAALNPLNQNFFSLIAKRGEKNYDLRSYIRDYVSSSTSPEKLDRWTAWGTFMGSYGRDGAVAPGKLGEEEEVPVGTPISPGFYGAYGVEQKSESFTLSQNANAFGILGYSSTINAPNNYFTKSLSTAMDVNGDGYPDILTSSGTLRAQVTGPTGGFGSSISLDSDKMITKSVTDNAGGVVQGFFINQDGRFVPKQTPVSGSLSFGNNETRREWVDINGDGLVDRLSYKSSSSLDLGLNNGRSLQSPIQLSQELSSSSNFSAGLGVNLSQMGNLTSKLGYSFSAGVSLNIVGSETEKAFMDLNGDGLPDIIEKDGSNFYVYLNTGTGFAQYTMGSLTGVGDLNKSTALGLSGSLAGTISFPIFTALFAHLKLSLSGNGQVNYSINKLSSSFKDMNGDGILDYIEEGSDGNLYIYYSELGKANLLKTVTNPLKGTITIDYKKVGNRYGLYPTEVKLHNTRIGDMMNWDMPNSKWVMASMAVFDGLNMLNGTSDLDGHDTLVYSYNYDGGIKSRREREFLGFTRVETNYPSDFGNVTKQNEAMEFISEVTEYARPVKNDPQYRRRFEYLKSIPFHQYSLHHIISMQSEQPVHVRKLMKHEALEYEYRNVEIDAGDTYFNRVEKNSGGDWVTVDWGTVSEAQSIFPALVTTTTTSVPQTTEPAKFHEMEYNIQYDDYFNVTQYSNEGVFDGGSRDSVIVDTIIHSYFDYITEYYNVGNLKYGTAPFVKIYEDPVTGEVCSYVASSTPGYSTDTVCSSAYVSTDPCSSIGGEDSVGIVHRKLMVDTIYIWKEKNNATYNGKIIAQMTYYTPGLTSNWQTNLLKTHKIYLGSVSPANLKRSIEVGSLDPGYNAPDQISNYLAGTTKAVTDITYDTRGNVTQVQGPANASNQRLTTNFTYDTKVYQYITNISNSYGDAICSIYDYRTGKLRKTVDINGHPTQYDYDDMFRLARVWAPREFENSSAPATIAFEYYPYGINPSGTSEEKIPVAITKHAINDNSGTPDGGIPVFTKDCASLITGGRPAMTNPLNTATFMDGLQRVVQIKKDVSRMGVLGAGNTKSREVSGITAYDRIGREINISLSHLEATGLGLGKLNKTKQPYLVDNKTYDYANRVIVSSKLKENGTMVQTNLTYNWDADIDGQDHFYTQVELDNTDTKTYTDSWGRNLAQVQVSSGGNAVTRFDFDALNQLTGSTDPVGEVSSYTFDNFGRMTQKSSPSQGTYSYTYDMAGNLTNMVTPSQTIEMGYHYKRLISKSMPLTGVINNVSYTYGSYQDGANGAGRVTQVVQGENFKTENFAYDELGNLVSEEKIFKIPQVGQQTYHTEYAYDSWGRITSIRYPDADLVSYNYSQYGGELYSIASTKGSNVQNVVTKTLYDGFGNIKKLFYGNGTNTVFTYNGITRRLTNVNLTDGNASTILNKNLTYDDRGNVGSMQNLASAASNGLGGVYSMTYGYDDLNRLSTTTGTFNTNVHNYSLDMDYSEAGDIISKSQSDKNASNNPYPNTNYTMGYFYNDTKKHQLDFIEGYKGGGRYDFEYNPEGSVTAIYTLDQGPVVYDQQLLWDEAQQLMAVKNHNGIHHYIYDHNGQRVMKSSLRGAGAETNDEGGRVDRLDPYIIYVNPYYVVTNYAQISEASKHYYMGSQRVASALITYPFQGEGDSDREGQDPGLGVTQNLFAVLEHFGLYEGEHFEPSVLLDFQFIENYDNEDGYNESTSGCSDDFCKCSQSQFWAGVVDEIDCSTLRVMYWYHPDYLGNTEFITDLSGDAHQYMWYSPWGEGLVDQYSNTGSYSSPYRFNAKELDPETNNYYYGARYYNPQTSIWYSVDELAQKYPELSPYAFVANNPVILVDPDGRDIWRVQNGQLKLYKKTNDNYHVFQNNKGTEVFRTNQQVNWSSKDRPITEMVKDYKQIVGLIAKSPRAQNTMKDRAAETGWDESQFCSAGEFVDRMKTQAQSQKTADAIGLAKDAALVVVAPGGVPGLDDATLIEQGNELINNGETIPQTVSRTVQQSVNNGQSFWQDLKSSVKSTIYNIENAVKNGKSPW